MIRAVIFDLYGTLIQLDRVSGPYLRLAQTVCPDDPWDLVRQSLVVETRDLHDFASRLNRNPNLTPTLTDRHLFDLECELRRDLKSSRVFDDTPATLAGLRRGGFKLGLISNAASPYKEPFFRHRLDAEFDAVLFSCDFGRTKPDPEIYLNMSCQLGVGPSEMLMVGDSRTGDYEGPRAVGMDSVLLRRQGKHPSFRSIERLDELSAMLLSG